jgi:hypothetical protein
MLTYNVYKDAVDEYCKLSDSMAMEAMKQYVAIIRACFEGTSLKQPTNKERVC